MANAEYIGRLLRPYQPRRPIAELVVEVNKIYHAFEARDYDRRHPEVTRQLPPLWQEMISHATRVGPSTAWRILNFGCGTGFEAEQLLRTLPRESVVQLTCYDPAPEMLERCRAKIGPLYPAALFCSDLRAVPSGPKPFNLLATNSLLHHLPDPVVTIGSLLPLLAPDAIWLAGHEPSNRFYRNGECLRVYECFQVNHQWRRFLVPRNYVRAFKERLGFRGIPAQQAAREAHRKRLFGRVPPPWLIVRLVDFYVANSSEEASSGRGLDFEAMQRDLAGTWKLRWMKSYAFMGPYFEGHLPRRWLRASRALSEKYPLDGANFCTVWQRV
jgi:SAM-dependent methyltransferase